MTEDVVHHHWSAARLPEERDWVTSSELINQSGITYRQLDYWCRTDLLTAYDGDGNPGSGFARRFGLDQITRAIALHELLTVGLSLQVCRQVIDDVVRDGQVHLGPFTITRNQQEAQPA